MLTEHPLRQVIADWLPEVDFAVLSHGFASHGRDYVLILQAGGTYELTLTHVVEMRHRTRVRDDIWPISWTDDFTDYAAWLAAGEPEGYVWGTNWSLAHPGLHILDDDAAAADWSERLRKPMYAMALETDRFELRVVFHGARTKMISEDNGILDQVLIPID